jgi:hypothetical protein
MKSIFYRPSIIALSLILVGCASNTGGVDEQKRQQALASTDKLIVPGKRIGPIGLGMGMDEVSAKLGRPSTTSNPSIDHSVMWRYGDLDMEITFSGDLHPL